MAIPPEWDVSSDPNDTYQKGFATHECVGKNGVTVRSGVELDSAKLGLIPRNALVVVDETKRASDGTHRCKLAAPHAGWCSAKVLLEMIATKRRAVEPLTKWSADAWAPTVVEMSALNRGGHARCKFPVTVVLPRGCSTKKCKEEHRWHLMAVFCGDGPATTSPLFAKLAARLQAEKHAPCVLLDYEGQGAARGSPPPDGDGGHAQDDIRGAIKWALARADQLILVGSGAGAQLLPGVANSVKDARKRIRCAVSFDYGTATPAARDVKSLLSKKGEALTPNDKHKEIRSFPRYYISGTGTNGTDDRMGLIALINGSTDASQVDVVDGANAADSPEAITRAMAWIKKQQKRAWMPWDDDPDDSSDDDEDTNE